MYIQADEFSGLFFSILSHLRSKKLSMMMLFHHIWTTIVIIAEESVYKMAELVAFKKF